MISNQGSRCAASNVEATATASDSAEVIAGTAVGTAFEAWRTWNSRKEGWVEHVDVDRIEASVVALKQLEFAGWKPSIVDLVQRVALLLRLVAVAYCCKA